MKLTRRQWLATAAGAALGSALPAASSAERRRATPSKSDRRLIITNLRVTPVALPDPPILAASGCHGPYFLRNVVEVETDAGITGVGETHGSETVTRALEQCRPIILDESPFAYRKFQAPLMRLGNSTYAAIELACLDAMGRATGRRVCELLGGPVREQVEFSAYLFFRFASDHPGVLGDSSIVDRRGRGRQALDAWGEVLTPEAMAELAGQFHRKWGFRNHKLKAGVLDPDLEIGALAAVNERFEGKHLLRIDPNGRWTVETAVRLGQKLKALPLEYYEDPVSGQGPMAEVRRRTGLRMSTNMCVTRFGHIPDAIRTQPIDVVLCDHHGWGGLTSCQALGTIADTLGWGLSQHSNNHGGITMAAMIHLGAAVPQLTCASDTHYPWLPDGADIIQGPNLAIKDGMMPVPSGPGLGVDLDRDKLARAHETYRKCGLRRRDDAATLRRVAPNWRQPAR